MCSTKLTASVGHDGGLQHAQGSANSFAHNLLDLDERAKERKITQLRIYFWALEAYTLFEDSLTKTVEAWEHFKSSSLDKVNDGLNDEDYEVSVELIEQSIDRLRGRIEWIQKKSEQVRRLREGLGFAAQMSDTSTTIIQNKNIRILTYFNILFLPLSLSAVGESLLTFEKARVLLTDVTGRVQHAIPPGKPMAVLRGSGGPNDRDHDCCHVCHDGQDSGRCRHHRQVF